MNILREVIDSAYQRGGLDVMKVFTVEPVFFTKLVEEAKALITANQPADVQNKTHGTNWTNPVGDVHQYSLWGPGKYDGKSYPDLTSRFPEPTKYPTIDTFVNAFPDKMSMRLNGLGPNSWLSAHRERVVLKQPSGVVTKVRFHIPLITNDQASVMCNFNRFKMNAGNVYFFNNGSVHSAENRGSEWRFHIVWDMLLTKRTHDLMFHGVGAPNFLIPDAKPVESTKVEYEGGYPSEHDEVSYETAIKDAKFSAVDPLGRVI